VRVRERGARGDVVVARDADATRLVEKECGDPCGVGLMACGACPIAYRRVKERTVVGFAAGHLRVAPRAEHGLRLREETVVCGGVRDVAHVARLLLERRVHLSLRGGRERVVTALAERVAVVEQERTARRGVRRVTLVALADLDGGVRVLLGEPLVRFVVAARAEDLTGRVRELVVVGAVCEMAVEAVAALERGVHVRGVELEALRFVAAETERIDVARDEARRARPVRVVTEAAVPRGRRVL
jgi:hypothetical protein